MDMEEPLRPADWDFRNVPEDEVICCCLWEYGRESRSLEFSALRHRILMRKLTGNKAWGGLPADESEFERHVAELDKREREAGFDESGLSDRFYACDIGFVRFYGSLRQCGGANAKPWQELSQKTRDAFLKELDDRSIFQPCSPSLVRDLEQLWTANSEHLLSVRASIRPPNDDSEDAVLFSPVEPCDLPEEKKEDLPRAKAMAFTIDFSRFSDREILEHFGGWLKEHRPERWHRPRHSFPGTRRGRKLNDYRVALERLAIMRLLHWYTPGELKRHMPAAWKLYGAKEDEFRRRIRAARVFFRECFPFLPPEEKPLSQDRFSVWLRAMGNAAE